MPAPYVWLQLLELQQHARVGGQLHEDVPEVVREDGRLRPHAACLLQHNTHGSEGQGAGCRVHCSRGMRVPVYNITFISVAQCRPLVIVYSSHSQAFHMSIIKLKFDAILGV